MYMNSRIVNYLKHLLDFGDTESDCSKFAIDVLPTVTYQR